MADLDKRLTKWKVSKQSVPVSDFEPILNKYFSGWDYKKRGGSHLYKIHHPKLIGLPGFGPGGNLTIPVYGGKHIKIYYIKELIKAINIITLEEK